MAVVRRKRRLKGQVSKIVVEFVDHKDQRYDTVGDYWREGDTLQVRISKLKKPAYEMAVLQHELLEWMLCELHGVKLQAIDKFDFGYPEGEEPGDDKNAPYHKEHVEATKVEKQIIKAAGEDWKEYDNSVGIPSKK